MTNYKPNPDTNSTAVDSNSIEPHIQEIGYAINQTISDLDDLLYQKFNIPFTNKIIIDERELTDQLDEIRRNIPDTIRQALEVLQERDTIIEEAETYAQKLVTQAKRDAAQEINESTIVQQANFEANQLKRQVVKECQEKRRQTELEIEQMYEQARRRVQQLEQAAFSNAELIQNQADDFADKILFNLENELSRMLKTVVTLSSQRQQGDSSNNAKESSSNGKGNSQLTVDS